jgi:HNH endonuclease
MASHQDTLCACGCQQSCKPGNTWKRGHYAKVHPSRPPIRPLLERFWERINKTDTCWLWMGNRITHGYGAIRHNGKSLLAHRLSYELHYGVIPGGLYCLHHCDTPACVRPDHLFLGTAQDNARDMASKGRQWGQRDPLLFTQTLAAFYHKHPEQQLRGERHGNSKLTADQVRAIRQTYASGNVSKSALARTFGVSVSLIVWIVSRAIWRHVDP